MLNYVYAYIAVTRYIRMNNFCQKSNDWRMHWVPKDEKYFIIVGNLLQKPNFFAIKQIQKTHENGIKICKKNFPPSYGDPGGPIIEACHCERRVLSSGTASIPSVASAVSVRISPRSLLARKWFSRCCGVRNVI